MATSDFITSVPDAVIATKNLREFFGELEWPGHRFPFGLWFRGQPDCSMPLEPTAFRTKRSWASNEEGLWDETNVWDHLRLRVPVHRRVYRTAFDWLCLMQHYSLPTRLLDWSESILPALYFAVKELPDSDGEVVVLNARRLNKHIRQRPTISTPDNAEVVIRAEMATTRSLKRLLNCKTVREAANEHDLSLQSLENRDPNSRFLMPIAVFPSRLNDRMSFQYSVFTLHGGKRYDPQFGDYFAGDTIPDPIGLERVNECVPANESVLKRFTIPSYAKADLLEELFNLGVHDGTLFPDIEGQKPYLDKLWWYPRRLDAANAQQQLVQRLPPNRHVR